MNMNPYFRKMLGIVLVMGAILVAGPPAFAAETVEYIHTDALGSPVATTDAAGNVIERTAYEPYGRVVNQPVKDGPGYAGHVMDASTELTYMQQRYYDPAVGRFLSNDPMEAVGNGTELFNRYRYAVNNPYRYMDPDGRVDWGMVGDAFKVEAGLGMGLGAKVKVGPVKVAIGLGSATPFGGGVTLAPDVYGFQEVAGPSFGLEIGGYGVGYKGGVGRSYEGRNDRLFSEEKSKGGFMFGRKSAEMSLDSDGGNAEFSVNASAGPLAKLAVAADLGKVADGLRSSGNSASSGLAGFKGTFRVEGRLDAKELSRTLKGVK